MKWTREEKLFIWNFSVIYGNDFKKMTIFLPHRSRHQIRSQLAFIKGKFEKGKPIF